MVTLPISDQPRDVRVDGSPSVAEVRKAEIRARLEAATPGPWSWEVSADRKWSWVGTDAPGRDFWDQPVAKCSDDDTAEFIAHAPTDVAFLLEENERLEGLLNTKTTESENTEGENR